jgi:hypothetical protein
MNSQHSEPLRVTAVEACRRVSRLVLSEVGNLLYGRAATLVVGEPTCWRVSVWLGLPTVGPVGQAGTLDVDAQTGEILHTQQLLDEIGERGNALAQSASD